MCGGSVTWNTKADRSSIRGERAKGGRHTVGGGGEKEQNVVGGFVGVRVLGVS